MNRSILDRLVAFVILLMLAPILLFLYFTILVIYRFDPIYRAPRSGKDLKTFRYLKFQTMYPLDPRLKITPKDAERITRLGLYLRKYSVDELPSLLNVVRGEMVLVGPRPMPVVYKNLYSQAQLRRFKVTPGVTGLAQISGRNSITWRRKFAIDCFYVKRRSICLDCYILAKTVRKVLLARDVHPTGTSVVENFDGSN